jgi:hypothetical protein
MVKRGAPTSPARGSGRGSIHLRGRGRYRVYSASLSLIITTILPRRGHSTPCRRTHPLPCPPPSFPPGSDRAGRCTEYSGKSEPLRPHGILVAFKWMDTTRTGRSTSTAPSENARGCVVWGPGPRPGLSSLFGCLESCHRTWVGVRMVPRSLGRALARVRRRTWAPM